MINHNIDVYCVQETWLEGDWDKIINGYLFIHHGVKKCSCKRGNHGVGIFLSPHLQQCYETVEKGFRIQSSNNIDDTVGGRFLCIKVKLNSVFQLVDGTYRNRRKNSNMSQHFSKYAQYICQ